MKTIFNKQKRSVAGVLIALTALTTALTGCQKDFELDLPLAVSARELSLTKDAGSTHVLVYSNGDWTARFTRPVKWASLNKLQGYGNNEIVFTYSANYGISRKIGVVFEKGSLADTVMFSQAGTITDASLSFSKPAVTLLMSRSQIFTPINTNLRYCIDDLEATVTYYDSDGLPNDPVTVLTRAEAEEGGEEGGDEQQAQPVDPWISNVSVTYKGITFDVTDNDTGFARIADLTLFIEDAKGEITKSVLTVTQGIDKPALKLDSNAETYEGYAQDCVVPATLNNLVPYSDQIGYDVAYDVPVAEEAEWILKPAITDEGLTFSLARNEGSGRAPPRSGSASPTNRAISFRPRAKSPRSPTRPPPTSPRCAPWLRARSRSSSISKATSSATRTARTSFRVPRPASSSSTAARTTGRPISRASTASGASA